MIYTKLTEYPYEFGIDKDYKLASINGVKVAAVTEEQYQELENQIAELNEQIATLTTEKNNLTTYINQTDASDSDILSGKKAYTKDGLRTGTMQNKGEQTVSASTVDKSGNNVLITIPQNGYYTTDSKLSISVNDIQSSVSGILGQLDFETDWNQGSSSYSFDYNFSNIDGKENLTKDNFLLVYSFFSTYCYTNKNYGINVGITKSYNPNTGILRVTYAGDYANSGLEGKGTIYCIK